MKVRIWTSLLVVYLLCQSVFAGTFHTPYPYEDNSDILPCVLRKSFDSYNNHREPLLHNHYTFFRAAIGVDYYAHNKLCDQPQIQDLVNASANYTSSEYQPERLSYSTLIGADISTISSQFLESDGLGISAQVCAFFGVARTLRLPGRLPGISGGVAREIISSYNNSFVSHRGEEIEEACNFDISHREIIDSIRAYVYLTRLMIDDEMSGAIKKLGIKNYIDTDFIEIAADRFFMGSLPGEDGRDRYLEARVEVTISNNFAIMEKELTQQDWFNLMGNNPSYFSSPGYCNDHIEIEKDGLITGLCPNNPVENVSWNDVQDYISKLNQGLGILGCDGLPSSPKGCYRLPTEAEWELAARGGYKRLPYSFDTYQNLGDYGWYHVNVPIRRRRPQSRPVGQKEPNPFGLYDMHGNVHEWVLDNFKVILPGGTDPLHSNSMMNANVYRGGSWNSYAHELRSASRKFGNPAFGYSYVGLRLVQNLQ